MTKPAITKAMKRQTTKRRKEQIKKAFRNPDYDFRKELVKTYRHRDSK